MDTVVETTYFNRVILKLYLIITYSYLNIRWYIHF